MSLFDIDDLPFIEAVAELAYCNPFTARRIELERIALGSAFDERGARWNIDSDYDSEHENLRAMCERAEGIIQRTQTRFEEESLDASEREHELYEDLVLWVLYHRYRESFDRSIAEGRVGRPTRKRTTIFDQFLAEARPYLRLGTVEAAHLFAWSFQIRRAFKNIMEYIVGNSAPAVKLRADIWESIFTYDMRRYRRVLYNRMADYTTLIIGPSGTGKELVAQAIGLSRYIPFDPAAQQFTEDFAGSFHSLHLAAMNPTLIESELFGHARGAFTGAVVDREGWLELCRPMGTVFLDEIGELAPTIQVKLLRVLQTRQFHRLGETQQRRFEGKIIAATHRNLSEQMADGSFREDLYYRMCSDIVQTPSLSSRLADAPDEMAALITYIVRKLIGDHEDVPRIAGQIEQWIATNLGAGYTWPGNVRELEQCVRNVLIRQTYQAANGRKNDKPHNRIARELLACELTADELLSRYCTLAYHRYGGYEQAARVLGIDRRTVKAKVDEELLGKIAGGTVGNDDGDYA